MSRMEQLETRLTALEREAARWRGTAARYRAGALGLLLLAGGAVCIAAAEAGAPLEKAEIPAIVQAHRLEIFDDAGKLVLAASGDERGGRLDVWTGEGRNIMRFAANDSGGDLNLWNGDGMTVFSAYATPAGGEAGVWSSAGTRLVHLAQGESGGRIEVANLAGETALTASAEATGGELTALNKDGGVALSAGAGAAGSGFIAARNAADKTILSITDDERYGTSFVLSDHLGNPRIMARTGDKGGAMTFANATGKPAVTLGVADPVGGGFIDLGNDAGTRILAAGADADGCGRLDLSNVDGQRVFSVDGMPDVGVAMALLDAKGKRSMLFGSRTEGGLLNIFNEREVPVVVAGYSPGRLGGALSIKNSRGLPVAHLAATAEDDGRLTVYDASGKKPRTVESPR